MNKTFFGLDQVLTSTRRGTEEDFEKEEETAVFFQYGMDTFISTLNPHAEAMIETCAAFGDVAICTVAPYQYAMSIIDGFEEFGNPDFGFGRFSVVLSREDLINGKPFSRGPGEKRLFIDDARHHGKQDFLQVESDEFIQVGPGFDISEFRQNVFNFFDPKVITYNF